MQQWGGGHAGWRNASTHSLRHPLHNSRYTCLAAHIQRLPMMYGNVPGEYCLSIPSPSRLTPLAEHDGQLRMPSPPGTPTRILAHRPVPAHVATTPAMFDVPQVRQRQRLFKRCFWPAQGPLQNSMTNSVIRNTSGRQSEADKRPPKQRQAKRAIPLRLGPLVVLPTQIALAFVAHKADDPTS